jgi:hypothetical protein
MLITLLCLALAEALHDAWDKAKVRADLALLDDPDYCRRALEAATSGLGLGRGCLTSLATSTRTAASSPQPRSHRRCPGR